MRNAVLISFLTLAAVAMPGGASIVDFCYVCEFSGTQGRCDTPDPLAGESGFCDCVVAPSGHICRLSGGPCLTGWLCGSDGGFIPDVQSIALPVPSGASQETRELIAGLNEDGATVSATGAALRITFGGVAYLSIISDGASGVSITDYASNGRETLDITGTGRNCGPVTSVSARYRVPVLRAHLECAYGVVSVPHGHRILTPAFTQR